MKANVENNWLRQENKRLQMENDRLKRLQETVLPVPNFSSIQNGDFPEALNGQVKSGTIEPGFASHSSQIDVEELADQLKKTQKELQQTKEELKLMQEEVHTDMSKINQLFAFFVK